MGGNDSELPESVLDTVHAVHPGVRPGGGQLPEPLVLEEIARGERQGITVRERVNAIAALARHPEGGDDPETYRQLATDSSAPGDVRLAAAAELRFLPPDRAEPPAIELLGSTDGDVVSAAIGTLTVVGSERAFDALGERFDEEAGTLGDPSSFEDVTPGRVAFARATIGHRHRLAETPRFGVDPVDRQDLQGIEMVGTEIDFAASVRDRTNGPLYGVEPRGDALELGAGVDDIPPLTFVPDRALAERPAEELLAAPSLWGVVLAYAEESDSYEPDLLAFADPADGGVTVTVMRTDGKALYVGEGAPDGDEIQLSLSDTGLVGTVPTRLRLLLGPEDLTVVDGVVDPSGAVSRTPEPFDRN